MRLILFFLISFISTGKNCLGQQKEDFKELSFIFKKFDTVSVVNCIIWDNDFKPLHLQSKIAHRIDSSLNTVMFDSLPERELGNIIKTADNYIKGLSANKRNDILKKIIYWCNAEKFLTDLAYFDVNFSFREIIFYLPRTKKLFSKYINDPALQDWDSLSSFQSNSLFYDVLNYIITLSEFDQLEFYRKYVEMAVKLSKEKTK
jgi:hypothetical protein